MNNDIKLLQGDCALLLKNIPSESVDAIITDPPYLYLKNQKLDKPFNKVVLKDFKELNEVQFFLEKENYNKRCNRKSKYNLTTNMHYNHSRCSSVAKMIKEGVVCKSIIKQTRDHYTMQHPTQKPVRLMERLMQLVTKEVDLVIDPFMGSGSTGIAALNLNRRFIGMEIDGEYFNIAKTRIEDALKEKEQDLFYEDKEVVNE